MKTYLNNIGAPVQLLGLAPLINPFIDKLSAQRGMLFSNHVPQAQVIHGCEAAKICTGFETLVGEYEYDSTERDEDIQVIEVLPKYFMNNNDESLKNNPYYTVIYRGTSTNTIGCFDIYKHIMRSEGFGYENQWLMLDQIKKGVYIPKNMKLNSSPAHDDNIYKMGTNLNTCYMSLPYVTEDAFMISESAAKKLTSDGYGSVSFKIAANQIPLNLYSTKDGEYKFIPDIGEQVRNDGVLCAVRTPTIESFVYDTTKDNLCNIQRLHDSVFYAPKGSQVIDIDVVVNRKSRIKTDKTIFSQVQKYRDAINVYYIRIWEIYQKYKKDFAITPAFNTLVTRAISSLLADGIKIPGYTKKADITLVKKKELIEFLYITIKFKYENTCSLGFKLSGRNGNKGTISKICPDNEMPIDVHGIRADIVVDPISVFNRMNPGQWYEQFFNRGAQLLELRLRELIEKDPSNANYEFAYNKIVEYLSDINPEWGTLVGEKHQLLQEKIGLVQESLYKEPGIMIQISPFQQGINLELVGKMRKKWNIDKSPVVFSIDTKNNVREQITTKKAILIGKEYWYLLYKMPHLRSSGIGYVNQYHTPVRANALAKVQYPISQTPIRTGEDEFRNLEMMCGNEIPARIAGMYANSPEAVECLGEHLAFDKEPGKLEAIEMTTDQIRQTNRIVGVVKHVFSTLGIDPNTNGSRLASVDYDQLELPTTTDKK